MGTNFIPSHAMHSVKRCLKLLHGPVEPSHLALSQHFAFAEPDVHLRTAERPRPAGAPYPVHHAPSSQLGQRLGRKARRDLEQEKSAADGNVDAVSKKSIQSVDHFVHFGLQVRMEPGQKIIQVRQASQVR